MRDVSDALKSMFDWFAPFYEKALPHSPPKLSTAKAVAKASMLAYDKDQKAIPRCFMDGFPKGVPASVRRDIVIHRLTAWAKKHASDIEQYMMDVYEVLIVFQDGDPTSQGKRIVPNRDTEANILAVQTQAAWDHAHCSGTHAREDYVAEQINRLQPKAQVQRHKLVNLPLPKPKGGK